MKTTLEWHAAHLDSCHGLLMGGLAFFPHQFVQRCRETMVILGAASGGSRPRASSLGLVARGSHDV